MAHTPVLVKEAIEGLSIKSGDTVLDATVNEGGHSSLIAQYLDEKGTIIGIDEDTDALVEARRNLGASRCTIILAHDNFRNLDRVLEKHGIQTVDKALFDIGLSSRQLDESKRGFSFQKDEPLLMTFCPDLETCAFTAREIVNTWTEQSITDVIYGYGGERFAKRIAREIVKERKIKPIERTGNLVAIIERSVPHGYRFGKIHPATKTFQALRIAVNDEFSALTEGIGKALERLNKGGRIAIISFHSCEDRIVKNFFRESAKTGLCVIITKKPIVPSDEEKRRNPRSRSAHLRIAEKL